MSQRQVNVDTNTVQGYYTPLNQRKHRKAKNVGKYYFNNFQYYNHQYNSPWNCWPPRHPHRRKPYRRPTTQPSRPSSPFSGTEEYTLKKIQEASDMIKKKLMMPLDVNKEVEKPKTGGAPAEYAENANENKGDRCEKIVARNNKKVAQYSVDEIHQKIITHITNLSHGKKVNLICASSSGYDLAIQQIQKQKQMELSKALRDMCSNQSVETSDAINSIIPDIGIKIEDLPLEVIQELSSTLDLDFDDGLHPLNGEFTIKLEICEDDNPTYAAESVSSDNASLTHCSNVENNFSTSECSTTKSRSNQTKSVSTTKSPSNQTKSVSTQTGHTSEQSISTQTDFNCDCDSPYQVTTDVKNLDDAIIAMFKIDKEMERLTRARQALFLDVQANLPQNGAPKENEIVATNVSSTNEEAEENLKSSGNKKRKVPQQKHLKTNSNDKRKVSQENHVKKKRNDKIKVRKEKRFYKESIEFKDIMEKILVIKITKEDTLLAASEGGKVYFINSRTGTTFATLQVSEKPITALCLWSPSKKPVHLFVGSLDVRIREYNCNSYDLLRSVLVSEPVQCMEVAWDYIFIGTTYGNLMRYSLKKSSIEFGDRISMDSVLVLKATLEGARRVLLVGTRNTPVCVRDAMSGLRLRTMNHIVSPTVYTLVLENSTVYCGTTSHDILVFNFHDGNLVHQHQTANSKGVGCMKVVGNLLFASCHNGQIYVYNVKRNKYVGAIEGPGSVILSMEVFKNVVVVGTMSCKFKLILIPNHILDSDRSEV